MEYCAGEYLYYPMNDWRTVSGQHFSNEILFGKDVRPARNAFLKHDLALKCVLLLIYSTIQNKENQQYLEKKINKHQQSLFKLFFSSNSSLLKYFLTLLVKTYTENLTLLVHVPQNETQLINSLVSYFHKHFKKNLKISLYTFLSIFKFSTFKEFSIF